MTPRAAVAAILVGALAGPAAPGKANADASAAGALVGYGSLLLAGTLGVFAGTTVVEDIRRSTDLMKA